MSFDSLLCMCGNLISYPTKQFSKLIFVRKILPHWPCEACWKWSSAIESNFIVIHERFKWHIVWFELNTVEKYYFCSVGVFFQKRKWKKMKRWEDMHAPACVYWTQPLHNINISLKPVEFQADLWRICCTHDWWKIGVNQDRTHALACQWPF